MKYLQSRINDYREMELVSLIQANVAEPLWYYFDVAIVSPEESNMDIDNKYLAIPSVRDFVSSNNQNIAICDYDNISLLLGYENREFYNRLNNIVLVGKKSEILLWISTSEPNYNGIDIEMATTNNRIYESDEVFDYCDYEKVSLIEALNNQGNFYVDIKNVCNEAASIIAELCNGNDNDFKFIISKNKTKIKK